MTRVGIIGTNWGRAHIGAFRRHGCEIGALVGIDRARTAAIAEAEAIPIGTDDLAVLDAMDVVVIATPPASHGDLVERFAALPILCEKPLCAAPPDDRFRARIGATRVWVNYAFGFLEVAARIRDVVRELGTVARADLRIEIAMSPPRSPGAWFVEVGSHPLAFLAQLFGPFSVVEHRISGDTLHAVLTNGDQLLHARLGPGSEPGFRFDLALSGDGGSIRARGGYLPERGGWMFEPLVVTGQPRGEGWRSSPERDIWFEANVAAVDAFLAHVHGDPTPTPLPTGAEALHIEAGLTPFF